ncbi:NAD(P)H-hydrate dehydratase [Kribbella sp. NBC_01245]|uniref:NAD(P)H-hydrate dehydratase n=1 Tax=Kribbella sp. NBC_01245 TaxID=2903578 RepID=UPI002E28F717|nr:NAD(P)H-hydrate dehydratase [Kribbella sp. NBC_01245]
MRRAYSVGQVRAAESALMAVLPDGTLMQRAAYGLSVALSNFMGFVYGARVVLLVGSGDNGGDALYAGVFLARRGARVTAVLLSDKAHPEGLAALRSAGGRVGSAEDVPGADVVVDGIVGIGGRPGLRPDALEVVELAARHGVPMVAVDTPSGVDVDTGETPSPHVRADLTVTFGTHKVCHLVDPAAAACGTVHLVDIGLDLPDLVPAAEAFQAADVRALYPIPHGESDKYSRGVLGLMAGSSQYPGAAVIATSGALGGPVGMIRYGGPDSVAADIRAVHPEVVHGEGRVQAWAVGSGLGQGFDRQAVARLLAGPEPVLVDADGLSAIDGPLEAPALLTPHAGELGRLLDVPRAEVEARRLEHARTAAERFQATVLLKGSTTVIAAPDGRVRVNTNASAWLATAGSGDVLAGLCGSLLASGLSPFDAAAVGAYLHAAAAHLAADGAPLTAMTLAAHLPAATRHTLIDQ